MTSQTAILEDKYEGGTPADRSLAAVAARLLQTILRVPYRANRLWSIFLSS